MTSHLYEETLTLIFTTCKKMTKHLSDTELRKLVQKKKNDKLKDILKNACPIDPVDRSGKTLLHLAAKYGNVELIKCLIECNCTINTTTPSGMTPLMTAITHNQFEATKLLLAAEPDVSVRNSSGTTALQMAVSRKVPADVVRRFIGLLRKLKCTTTRIVLMLERAGCTLKYALKFNDSAILRGLLERRETISYRESSSLIREAMDYTGRDSVLNLIALMRYGPGRSTRKSIFFREISFELEDFLFPRLNAGYVKALVMQMMKVNSIDADFVMYLSKVFGEGTKSAVKLWLQCNVHVHVKKRFGKDLVAHMFGNRKANAIKLTSMMKSIDIEGRGDNGFSALHFAVSKDLTDNVEFLLEKGADPNLKSDFGLTPLFLAHDRKCVKLLLQAGADVQAVDDEGLSIIEVNGRSTTHELVLAQLAIIEAKGEVVRPYMYEKINGNRSFKEFYQKCRSQMEWMKRRRIFPYVTLLDVLIDKPEKIAGHVTNREKRSRLMEWYYECPLQRYYFSILKRNLKRAVKIFKLKCKAALIVAGMMKLFDRDHLVVRKIVDYLRYEDLLVFA